MRKKSLVVWLLGLWRVEKLEILFLVIVDDPFRISVGLYFIQVDSIAFLTIFRFYLLLDLFFCVGNHLFPVGIDSTITSIDVFLETVIKTSLP